jgi:hypothetical protein
MAFVMAKPLKVTTTRGEAERRGVTQQAVRDLIRAGRLDAEKIAGRWLILAAGRRRGGS